MKHDSSEELSKIRESRHLTEILDDHLDKFFILLLSAHLTIQDHLPYFLEKELRKVCKVFSKLELVKMNETHCLMSAFDEFDRNFRKVRIIYFENELKYLCNGIQVLLIKIW